MFMRVVVPVYDITGKYLIGCVGRSINPECVLCGRYHAGNRACPSNPIEEKWARKWVNSTGFNTGNHLYNIWNAAEPAKEKQKLILVEGQGDVWRLYEAGIFNVVGLFGNKLTDNQFALIESLGITDIYIALDIDEEGLKGRGKVREKLAMYYNLHDIDLTAKDVGDMSDADIRITFKDAI
jgi:5S rRNA maturation endonuclease (ribonuclease M5)